MKFILGIFMSVLSMATSATEDRIYQSDSIKVVLSLQDKKVVYYDPLIFTATYTNKGNKVIRFNHMRLPDDMHNSNFYVFKDGKPLPFIGAYAKRFRHPEDDVYLEPGATMSIDFSLDNRYDLSKPGHYLVSFVVNTMGNEQGYHPKWSKQLGNKPVASISFDIIEDRTQYLREQPNSIINYTESQAKSLECTGDRASVLATAKSDAIAMANKAYSNITRAGHDTPFTNWFGFYTEGWAWLKNLRRENYFFHPTWNNIRLALLLGSKSLTCGHPTYCDDKKIATVVPAGDTIYFCESFWTIPRQGVPHSITDFNINTHGGIVIHEISHFNDILSALDYEYDPIEIRRMVELKQFDRVDKNAENYELYAEDVWANK